MDGGMTGFVTHAGIFACMYVAAPVIGASALLLLYVLAVALNGGNP